MGEGMCKLFFDQVSERHTFTVLSSSSAPEAMMLSDG